MQAAARHANLYMKDVDIENIDQLPGIRLKSGDDFNFRCYPGIGCFNKCCRNLNLFLYPYDVLRLKKQLQITSDRFLDQYVDVVLREGNFFPEVLLRMSDDSEKKCPYLTPEGCSVYPNRPDTCRTFPVEQGLVFNDRDGRSQLIQFFRPPDFCLGQHESQSWTTSTWSQDQDAVLYNKMTSRWAELKRLFQVDPWGAEGPEGSRAKMAFMAIYNLDSFRSFVFGSSFLKRYKVKSALSKKLQRDDLELLKFGFAWVKFFIWGIKSKKFRLR